MLSATDIAFRPKFLTSRTKRHFLTNFALVFSFFFNRIFHVFLRSLNILPICFQVKMAKLHSGQNSWPVVTSGIFVQNLQDFFFFQNNFPFYSWTTKYAICMFWCKNANIVFRSKFFTCQTKGLFWTNYARVFYLFILLYFIVIQFSTFFYVLWIYCLHVFIEKWRRCIQLKFLTNRNFANFRTKFTRIFFSFERIFHFLLEPQNMLSASFGAKTTKLHFGRNSWPVETSGIFVQNLQDFFLFQMNFPFYSLTNKYAICMFWCKNVNIFLQTLPFFFSLFFL